MTRALLPPNDGDNGENGDEELNALVERLGQILSDLPPEQREEITALVERIDLLLSEIPADQREELRAQITKITEFRFRGPLPPPIMLAQYGDILPDLPERIVAMAEREQTLAQERAMARIALSDRVVRSDSQRTNRGMLVAIGAVAGGLAVSLWLIAVGAYWPAVGTFLGDLLVPAAIVFSAWIGRSRKKNGD